MITVTHDAPFASGWPAARATDAGLGAVTDCVAHDVPSDPRHLPRTFRLTLVLRRALVASVTFAPSGCWPPLTHVLPDGSRSRCRFIATTSVGRRRTRDAKSLPQSLDRCRRCRRSRVRRPAVASRRRTRAQACLVPLHGLRRCMKTVCFRLSRLATPAMQTSARCALPSLHDVPSARGAPAPRVPFHPSRRRAPVGVVTAHTIRRTTPATQTPPRRFLHHYKLPSPQSAPSITGPC
jgi:hypothetical protein